MIYKFHVCPAIGCNETISTSLIMCSAHWEKLPVTFQRKLLSHFNSMFSISVQNIEFYKWMRRAKISIACQEKSSVTLDILPDHEFLVLSEKQALNELIQRYAAC